MRKAIRLLIVALAVLAVSCGSETEDAQTTSVAPTPDTSATTTTAESSTATAAGADEEFCQLMSARDTAMETMDILDPESVEEAHRQSLKAIRSARDLVPGDIRAEYDTLAFAFEDFVVALEEHDWLITEIPESDSRVLRLASDEAFVAIDAVIDYCGLEAGSADAGAAADSSGSGSDPHALNDLVAPGAVLLSETSSGIKILTSTASFDDTVAYYEEVLGEGPVNVDGAAGDRVASFLAEAPVDVLVQVEEAGDELLIYITVNG